MTQSALPGLHHVTAISGPPQANVDFFTKVLGQRLVKKTINFDDPGTYHLYYGNQTADPGTILTFFPFVGARPGRPGAGMASAYAYATSDLDDWVRELSARGVEIEGPVERFGARVVTLRDPDGAAVELIGVPGAGTPAEGGFYSATLHEADLEPTQRLMTDVLGYEEAGHESGPEGERLRLKAPGDARGAVLDLVRSQSRGVSGAGTIHHIAFRAEDDDTQLAWREKLLSQGYDVTPVIDRQYFNAIYFREPGGVLFEIATDPPGFTRDEELAHLGEALKLPEQYEAMRPRIEAALPEIRV
ncbi:ring-cleaving dioxygenase [Aestuariibius insulae]|uniref:ring-cleaving dioxygenase n=1 Tax=Aestuariibius insulae TaxID=2058287 RepID=UPI00345E0A1D